MDAENIEVDASKAIDQSESTSLPPVAIHSEGKPILAPSTGDSEVPITPGSGGAEPPRDNTAAVIDDLEDGEVAVEQPVASSVHVDNVESVKITAGSEAQQQSPKSCPTDRSEEPANDSGPECDTDSDPCLDDSTSDSDIESVEDGMITREELDRFMADPKQNSGLFASLDDDEIPRTKNEIDPATLEIPDRTTMLISTNAKLQAIGSILSLVEGVMVVKATEGHPPVDIGGALVLGDRTPLGWVDDVIGPVDYPFYLIRLGENHGIASDLIAPGTTVFAVDELCQYLKVSTLDSKGTDASHLDDEENPNIVYYSDDEDERNARKRSKPARRHSIRQGICR